MGFKSFLLRLLAFIFIAFIGFYFTSKFDNSDHDFTNDNNVLSLKYKNRFDSLDILFVGNSYCYSGIIPQYLDSINYRTYNLGISTAGAFFYELVVNEYLKNCKQQPKAIYFLISPTTFSTFSDNFLAYPIHRYLEKPISNEEVTLKYNLHRTYIEMMHKSFKKGCKNILKNRQKDDNYHELITSKGYIKSNDVCTQKIINQTQHLYYPLRSNVFSDHKLVYLLKYLRELRDKSKIEVVIFDLPTYKLEDYFNSPFILKYDSIKNNFKKEFKFVALDSTLSNSNYQNIDHLNESGARVVTRRLINLIESTQNKER
jgi:hypothetical protein